MARIDSNKWSIGIRGFGTRNARSVLVLIDGRTVYTELLAGTYWEVQDTMLEDVDRIEVIRGPGATIWGPNAVNGVINIITKNSRQSRGSLASVGGGNVDQGIANYRYGAGNENASYRIYGKGFTRGPEYHPDGRNFDDWRAARAGFRADLQLNRRDSLTLEGDAYKEEAGEAVNAVTYAPPYQRIVNSNADLFGADILGRWQRTLQNGSDIQIQAYYDRTNRYEPNIGERRDTFDIDFINHIRPLERHNLSWGLGLRFSHANDLEVVSGLTFLPHVRTDQLYTAFLQDDIALVDNRLSLTLGTKLLRTNFTGFQFQPSARLMWTPSESQSIWAAFTHAVRTPSDAEENFYLSGFTGSFGPGGLPLMARFNANPGFSSEQLNGYELGFRRFLGKSVMVDVSGYYNHYHDLFDEEITGPVFLEDSPPPAHYLLPAQFGNGLYGYTKGIEVAPEWRPAAFWRLRGSYSFLHMNIGKAPQSKDVGSFPAIIGSSPQHEADVQSSFDLSKAFQLDLIYRYVSALPAQNVPSYSTGDVRFAWRFRHEFEIELVGHNLLQPYHFEYGGDPTLVGIKRAGFLRLTWTR